jgi:hypothetical protein
MCNVLIKYIKHNNSACSESETKPVIPLVDLVYSYRYDRSELKDSYIEFVWCNIPMEGRVYAKSNKIND